jgi:hypothetical protein
LCGEIEHEAREKTVFVSISTSSEENVQFSIKVSLEHNFIMKLVEKKYKN